MGVRTGPEPSEAFPTGRNFTGAATLKRSMCPQIKRFLAGVLAGTALCAPVSASASDVLEVDGSRTARVDDPFVPARADSDLGREPRARRGRTTSARSSSHGARRAARASARKRKPKTTRGQRAVGRALRAALDRRHLSRERYNRFRGVYERARRTRKRLRGARGRELGSVISALEGIALRRGLTSSRMPPLFLILKRNIEYWPRKPFPRNRDRVRFRGSELLFEYYAGSGLQLQPLVNFKKANLMHGACVKDTGEPCREAGLRRLLKEMVSTSSRRGRFRAWEYFFSFGGGRPPWVSGMAQATGIQAFGRASQLLGDDRLLRYAREALGAFQTPPPTGVVTPGPLGGPHYLQYSFAPRLYILNAFLQSVIGLYDYSVITGDGAARALYARAEPEARGEVPLHDTGDWSSYSYAGRDSTREYHELLREFLEALCGRLRHATYCDTAERFRRYTIEPAELALLGPQLATQGVETGVRFSVSKLSAVQIRITRDGRTALDEVATFRRGEHGFTWEPRGVGIYEISLAAKELRTGRELRTRMSGEIESLPAP